MALGFDSSYLPFELLDLRDSYFYERYKSLGTNIPLSGNEHPLRYRHLLIGLDTAFLAVRRIYHPS